MDLSPPISFSLRPRARLLRTIGDELISSETVALIELVKNSYDADATHVLIRFSGILEEGQGVLEIMDNGNGMSIDTIENAWMELATLSKKTRNKRVTESKRRVLGEKGIGRFASSRLANSLEIISRAKESTKEVRAIFDWQQFDDPDRYLDEIDILWEETEPEDIKPDGEINLLQVVSEADSPEIDLNHGTILRMEPLRCVWSKERIKTLRNGLSRLMSPFSRISDFSIYLDLPISLQDFSGLITPPDVLEKPHYRIQGDVDRDGLAKLNIFVGQGNKNQKSHFNDLLRLRSSRKPACGPFYIDLRVWDLDDNEFWKELASVHNSKISIVRKDLRNASGVNIYRDDFRVLPFGEPDNDWLRLDLRRVQNPTKCVSNNQIFGYIRINSDDNPELRDQSNREGLVTSEAYSDLKNLTREILSLLEAERYVYRRPKKKEESRDNQTSLFGGLNIKPLKDIILSDYGNDDKLISAFKTQEKEIEQQVEIVKETLSKYQRLASLGMLIDTILHEGRTPLSSIDTQAKIGTRDIERVKVKSDILSKLLLRFEKIRESARLIGSLFSQIEPFTGRKKGRPKTIILEDEIRRSLEFFIQEAKRNHIQIKLPDSQTKVTIEPTEIQQVLINLFSNSIYWLQKVSADQRSILIQVRRLPSGAVQITFSDSGPGVEVKFRDSIFDPYFSRKQDGVGLGLSIAGEIVTEYYGGSLELIDQGPLPGATFQITLIKRV